MFVADDLMPLIFHRGEQVFDWRYGRKIKEAKSIFRRICQTLERSAQQKLER
jgi:hypothetical protein